MTRYCICEPGNPCDYHIATCITCQPPGHCQGHPNAQPPLRLRYEAAKAVGEFLRSFGDTNDTTKKPPVHFSSRSA